MGARKAMIFSAGSGAEFFPAAKWRLKERSGHTSSNSAVIRRNILILHIFSMGKKLMTGAGRVFQLKEAIDKQAAEEAVNTYKIEGKSIGKKNGFIKTASLYVLKHIELSELITSFIKKELSSCVLEGAS